MKKQYPEVDFFVSIQPAQSALAYPNICVSELLENKSPYPGLAFKYLKTLHDAL
jgi:hypothetical protein